MTEKAVLYRVEDNTGYLTINRETKRNSISHDVISLFFKYLDEAEKDDQVRVVCITGAGDKAFCSGADLNGADSDSTQLFANLLKRIAGYTKPTVARINGYCLAGGTGFMLACDIVIASDTAKFGTPEVNVGLFPMMIGALIFRNVPKKKAMEMILLGDRLTAVQALDMGLVTRIVPPTQLDEETGRVLKLLASKSPIGIKLGKSAFYHITDMPLEEALDYLSGQLKKVTATEDAVEGVAAFLEKRTPNFKGR